jgi:hypothetical protein
MSGAAFSAESFERTSVVAVLQATNAFVAGTLEFPRNGEETSEANPPPPPNRRFRKPRNRSAPRPVQPLLTTHPPTGDPNPRGDRIQQDRQTRQIHQTRQGRRPRRNHRLRKTMWVRSCHEFGPHVSPIGLRGHRTDPGPPHAATRPMGCYAVTPLSSPPDPRER